MLRETPFLAIRTDDGISLRCEHCLTPINHDLKTDAQYILNKSHQVPFRVSDLKAASTNTCRCLSGGVCKVLYCSDICRDKHASFHDLLCPASRCYETREFVKRSLQSCPYVFAAAAFYLKVIISSKLDVDAMQWIKDNYPMDANRAGILDGDNNDNDEVIELWLLFVSSASQHFPGESTADIPINLKRSDWTYLYNVILRYAHLVQVNNPLVDFLKQQCGRLSTDDRAFLRKQPEIIGLYRLHENSHSEIAGLNRELSEREFCALIHTACSTMSPFDRSRDSILIMPQAGETVITLPFSCMPSASIDLVINDNACPQMVVRKSQADSPALTLPQSINSLFRQSLEFHSTFSLSVEMHDIAQIGVTEFNKRLLHDTKNFLNGHSKDNCSCKLCTFAQKVSSSVTNTSSSWDFMTDINIADCIEVGSYLLSHDSLSLKSMAAVILQAGYIELSKRQERKELADCLHNFATLLLDIVTLPELYGSNFTPSRPVVIRNHWRTACKMWLHCHKTSPEHDIARNQVNKLFSYGSGYDFMTNNQNSVRGNEDLSNTVPFERISTSRGTDIYRTRLPVLDHLECKWIIEETEKHALKSTWTNNRHYSVPTTDIPLHEIPIVLKWFQNSFQHKVRGLLHDQFVDEFDGDLNSFYINDLFIVKYDATLGVDENGNGLESTCDNKDGSWQWSSKNIQVKDMRKTEHQRFLPLHYDQSTHSVVIALNSSSEFSGGGTYFDDLKDVMSLRQGCMLSFCGNQLLHSGEPITSGTRYIMTIFIFLGAKEEYIKKRKYVRSLASAEIHDTTLDAGRDRNVFEGKKATKTSISSNTTTNNKKTNIDGDNINDISINKNKSKSSFAFNFF